MEINDLSTYKEAYSDEFKFNDESTASLNWYSRRLCNDIRINRYTSLLSLGIGRSIVSLNLTNELKHYLKRHVIHEGSSDIIKSFRSQQNIPMEVEIIETLFEDYKTIETYDAIEAGFVLEHVDDPALILHNLRDLLKVGGRIYLAVPNARSLHRILGYEAGLLDSCYNLSDYDLQLGHKRYFDITSFTELIIDCGLKILSVEGIFLKPLTSDQLSQLQLDPRIMEALFKVGQNYPEICNSIYIVATKCDKNLK